MDKKILKYFEGLILVNFDEIYRVRSVQNKYDLNAGTSADRGKEAVLAGIL